MTSEFRKKLQEIINYYSKENGSDTPDFILAKYLEDTLKAFDRAVQSREEWYSIRTTSAPSTVVYKKVEINKEHE